MSDARFFHYLMSLAITVVICWGIWSALVWGQAGAPTVTSQWIGDIYAKKTEIAKELGSPKLVIVAGSNGLFGFSCQQINAALDYSCLNGATQGGLSLSYLLWRAQQDFLAPGDTVLLPLEYELYILRSRLRPTFLDFLWSRDPGYFWTVSSLTQLEMLMGVSTERLKAGWRAKFKPKKLQKDRYSSKTLNQFGDETNNVADARRPEQIARVENSEPFEFTGSESLHSNFRTLESFIQWCQQHQIQILTTWPNILEGDTYAKPEAQRFFERVQAFYQDNNVPVIGSPRDGQRPKKDLFDTRHHLNSMGQQARTVQIIPQLKPYLKN
ncbi:MAG: hypothetical protein AAGG02_18685 [Cyanobacteria bacterium P01_H01_bin.15]